MMLSLSQIVSDDSLSGRFLVFEGVDGSGKSTQARLLHSFLSSRGHATVLLLNREATHRGLKEIQSIIEKLRCSTWYSSIAHVYLSGAYFALASQNIVRPAVSEGKLVIVDRYYYSTIVYSTIVGLEEDWLLHIKRGLLVPDLVLFLRLPPQLAITRKAENDDLAFRQKADLAYQRLFARISHDVRTAEVNAAGKVDDVHIEVMKTLRSHFENDTRFV
jgi:dTMP kinase